MNNILARGTWYIGKAPLLVYPWGADSRSNTIKTIALWVRFEKVPDCYWTQEGLSNIASVIGRPLGADALTSKLEVLPFARMCVEYEIGKDLPNKIEVMDLIPGTEELKLVEVKVTYPVKPLVCSGCNALGNLVGACPVTKRHWVPKIIQPVANQDSAATGVVDRPVEQSTPLKSYTQPPAGNEHLVTPIDCDENDNTWQTVHPRKSCSPASVAYSDASPTPLNTFKNLAQVDEVDAKRASSSHLSKSQLKKRKKALLKPSHQSF
ncbi:hypothetical protein POM88_008917 [Heracleum sosnowskyi]|uniref:DUF4283 domain-containing protein n=1 Tax=Heracleum sosnowskyi TaxID=360622 RepID=A0AAD8J7R0_9APIA|nr:hypothetical protein POM88_008917 [Heracleum sosnowskyi]